MSQYFVMLLIMHYLDLAKPVNVTSCCERWSNNLVLCKHNCQRSATCGETNNKFSYFSDKARQLIVDVHNEIRNLIASGETSFPPAKNMRTMNYDKELEFYAGCQIKQCNDEMHFNVDCKDEEYSVNMFSLLYPVEFNVTLETDSLLIINAAKHWSQDMIVVSDINNFKLIDAITGYKKYFKLFDDELANIIGANTSKVGCARLLRNNYGISYHYGPFYYILTCLYQSAVVEDQAIYEPGPIDCDEINPNWISLCDSETDFREHYFVAPFELNSANKLQYYIAFLLITFVLQLLL